MAKHPGGRPTEYRANFHPADFIRLSKEGKNFTEIACEWDLDRETLYHWAKKHPEFVGAIKKGRQYLESWYTKIGRSALLGKPVEGTRQFANLGFYVWMTKNVLKWSDKVEIEETNIDVHEDLSDEELEKAAK